MCRGLFDPVTLRDQGSPATQGGLPVATIQPREHGEKHEMSSAFRRFLYLRKHPGCSEAAGVLRLVDCHLSANRRCFEADFSTGGGQLRHARSPAATLHMHARTSPWTLLVSCSEPDYLRTSLPDSLIRFRGDHCTSSSKRGLQSSACCVSLACVLSARADAAISSFVNWCRTCRFLRSRTLPWALVAVLLSSSCWW